MFCIRVGFNIKFRLDANCSTYLARNQSSLDDLLYLEGQVNKETPADSKAVSSIHLKVISESQPEYRLERMLRRGKFEEAEEFARSFSLDVEIVYKAHLQTLSNDIQPWSTGKTSLEESSNKFKSLLHKIKVREKWLWRERSRLKGVNLCFSFLLLGCGICG